MESLYFRRSQKLRLAIQGLGSAGRSRLKAIQENPDFELAGIISRRSDHATLDLASALCDPQLDAILVCTENADHEHSVQKILEAQKHVLCEYPLALSFSAAQRLFDLAQQNNRLLHVEHIGLLSSDHLKIKEELKVKGPLIRGEYLFQAGWSEKTADIQHTGPHAILALPRLLQIADWLGAFTLEACEKKQSEDGFSLHLHLKFPEGGILGFTEEHQKGLPRRRSFVAECQKGSVHWKSGVMTENLFAQDLVWFKERIFAAKANYYSEDLMLQVLKELESIF